MDQMEDAEMMTQQTKPSYVGLGLWALAFVVGLGIVLTGHGVWWHWAIAIVVALIPAAVFDAVLDRVRGVR